MSKTPPRTERVAGAETAQAKHASFADETGPGRSRDRERQKPAV